jgi:hypothetical protein
MFWYNLEKFDGSDLVPWLDDATRRRIVTFFQEIRDKERVASLRGQQRYRDYLNSPLFSTYPLDSSSALGRQRL